MNPPRKTCLIVDDSPVVRSIASKHLEALGFITDEAANGLEAVAVCTRCMPDAVLLDRNMPVLDGVACVRMVRALPGGERPKVIFCTAENTAAGIEEAMRAGADEYIMKPFDREILQLKFAMVGVL